MSAGGGGGGLATRLSMIHLPRTTGDVRLACEVTMRTPPIPRMPNRRSSDSVTRRMWLP